MRPTLPLLRLRLSASASTRTPSATSSLIRGAFLPSIGQVSHRPTAVLVRNLSGLGRKTSASVDTERHWKAVSRDPPAKHPHGTQALVASSSGFLGLLLLFSIGFGLGFVTLDGIWRKETLEPTAQDLAGNADAMSGEIAPGRPGNLTPEQEEKLRRLWQLVFKVCSIAHADNGAGAAPSSATAPVAATAAAEKTDSKAKKGRLSIFSRRGRKESDPEPTPTSAGQMPSVLLTPAKEGEHDKYGQTQHFYDTLASMTPESIRTTIWSMVKHDHPDALLLRFLRARKWDVEKALIMMISTMNWRASDMKVDDDIMRNGDAAAVEAEKNATDPAAQRLGHDFLQQARIGKSFIHGVDKIGRPVCYVRCRLHKQGEQVEESLERYTVYVIETCRYLLQPPIDTATIVFDMTGFSLANMDYTPVKFMIKCFEANYPESLGAVLVHKAPWVFQGVWKVIRGWLDPVVANKVHFTNNVKEMEEFIAVKQLPKELEGEEDWEYAFVEPTPGENDQMKDTATRDRLLAAREMLVKEFEDTTAQWIQHPEGEKAAEIKARRATLATQLREDYWRVDPYLRARSLYDRTGVLQAGGKIDFYPKPKATQETEKTVAELTNGFAAVTLAPAAATAVETSSDDVD